MEKKISYLNRTYADYKEALIEMSERYYPDLSNNFRDASIASWQIDMLADIADNLSYYIDRAFQETNINSAQEKSSLYAMARSNGVKIPGPKGAIAEVRISVILQEEDCSDGPVIKRGTKFTSGSQQFELLDDVDFKSQFDINGNSDRTIIPQLNRNGINNGYLVSKLAIVTAGETRVYSKTIKASEVKPFMEVLLPFENVMNIESILMVNETSNKSIPTYGAFYGTGCSDGSITRFYEVDNLAQNKCWLEDGESEVNSGTLSGMPFYHITKGKWTPIKHKFITEYTDKGYLKIIFGCGTGEYNSIDDVSPMNQWLMSRILNNNNLGILPSPNTTLHILYRVGGGASSNVAKGAINKISYLNINFADNSNVSEITTTLKVENTTPSFSGKDMPSEQEMKYFIKYNKSAQNRCVTVKDYIDRLLLLPPKFGTPFRVGVAEENNKIVIYLLGIDNTGHLTTAIPSLLVENIKNYLSEYKTIGDCVEIKSGKIINLSFDISAIVDKNYNEVDVVSQIIKTVEEYMAINKHLMGEEIYVGDLLKEVAKVDGVINVISIDVINKFGDDYGDMINQETIPSENADNQNIVDLEASDWILYNDGDSMMEIKNPNVDINVKIKKR